MIRKEEVYDWFEHLSGAQRIDFLCGLLQKCVPLELRFIGSCLENLAKRNYIYLRDAEVKANNLKEVSLLEDIAEKMIRSKLIVSLALLHTTNRLCASTLYESLIQFDCSSLILDRVHVSTDRKKVIDELLLLLLMAANHPAFSADQRIQLSKRLVQLSTKLVRECEYEDVDPSWTEDVECEATNSEASLTNNNNTLVSSMATINKIEAYDYRKRASDSKVEYLVRVTWSDGSVVEISRTHKEFYDFHMQLVKGYPKEVECSSNRKIPFLTVQYLPLSHRDDHAKNRLQDIADYCSKITTMPPNILCSEHVVNFFRDGPLLENSQSTHSNDLTMVAVSPISPVTNATSLSDFTEPTQARHSSPQTESPAAYAAKPPAANSVTSDLTEISVNLHANDKQPNSRKPSVSEEMEISESRSRAHSQSHSVSLSNEMANAGFPANSVIDILKRLRLEEYQNLLKTIPFERLLNFSANDFQQVGLKLQDAKKFVDHLHQMRQPVEIPVNGFFAPPYPNNMPMFHPMSSHPHLSYMPGLYPMPHPASFASMPLVAPSMASTADTISSEYSSPAVSPAPRVAPQPDTSSSEDNDGDLRCAGTINRKRSDTAPTGSRPREFQPPLMPNPYLRSQLMSNPVMHYPMQFMPQFAPPPPPLRSQMPPMVSPTGYQSDPTSNNMFPHPSHMLNNMSNRFPVPRSNFVPNANHRFAKPKTPVNSSSNGVGLLQHHQHQQQQHQQQQQHHQQQHHQHQQQHGGTNNGHHKRRPSHRIGGGSSSKQYQGNSASANRHFANGIESGSGGALPRPNGADSSGRPSAFGGGGRHSQLPSPDCQTAIPSGNSESANGYPPEQSGAEARSFTPNSTSSVASSVSKASPGGKETPTMPAVSTPTMPLHSPNCHFPMNLYHINPMHMGPGALHSIPSAYMSMHNALPPELMLGGMYYPTAGMGLYDSRLHSYAMQQQPPQQEKKKTYCPNCAQPGHVLNECPDRRTDNTAQFRLNYEPEDS